MLPMDMPNAPPQETPIVLAQAATPSAGGTQPDYLLNACKEVPSGAGETAMNAISPAGMLAAHLGNLSHRYIDLAAQATMKLTQLESVSHGQLHAKTASGRVYYMYESEPGYVGKDKAVFMAEFEGVRYKIVVNIVVSEELYRNPLVEGEEPACPPPQLIKVNKPASGSSFYDLNSPSTSLRTGISVTFVNFKNAAKPGWGY